MVRRSRATAWHNAGRVHPSADVSTCTKLKRRATSLQTEAPRHKDRVELLGYMAALLLQKEVTQKSFLQPISRCEGFLSAPFFVTKIWGNDKVKGFTLVHSQSSHSGSSAFFPQFPVDDGVVLVVFHGVLLLVLLLSFVFMFLRRVP